MNSVGDDDLTIHELCGRRGLDYSWTLWETMTWLFMNSVGDDDLTIHELCGRRYATSWSNCWYSTIVVQCLVYVTLSYTCIWSKI